jgi:MYXO-CTERM domain-containing protein
VDLNLLDASDTIFRIGAFGTSQASPLEKFVGNTSVHPVSHSQVLLADSRWGLYTVNATNVVTVPEFDLETSCANIAAGTLESDALATTLNSLGILAGDADQNGAIEFADFLALSGSFGERKVGYARGDFDCDGVVQFPDFLILSRNFGASVAATNLADTNLASVSTPEPTGNSQLLLGLLGLSLLLRIRRS